MMYQLPSFGRQTAKSVLPSPVVVTRNRDIALASPLLDRLGPGRAVDDVPVPFAGTPDGEIGPTGAVILCRDGDIPFASPLPDSPTPGSVDDVPVAFTGTPYTEVSCAFRQRVIARWHDERAVEVWFRLDKASRLREGVVSRAPSHGARVLPTRPPSPVDIALSP